MLSRSAAHNSGAGKLAHLSDDGLGEGQDPLGIKVAASCTVLRMEAHQRRLECPDSLLHVAEGLQKHQIQGFDDGR